MFRPDLLARCRAFRRRDPRRYAAVVLAILASERRRALPGQYAAARRILLNV